VLGRRLASVAPDHVPSSFLSAVEGALERSRGRGLLLERLTLDVVSSLERAGVRVVALKGPLLAERLYGDLGMRLSTDLDLLVPPESFHDAVAILSRSGWSRPTDVPWEDGLPLFEWSLAPRDDWRPPIDLHWRLHWHERDFSRAFVERSRPNRDGALVPNPADELVALLLHYTRDGFCGLRSAVDIAAWWDRHGDELAPGALDELAADHPEVLPAIVAASAVVRERLGVPVERVLGALGRLDPHAYRRAGRLQDLVGLCTGHERRALTVLVDWDVTPPGGRVAFVRRNFAPPPRVIGKIYGLPAQARIRQAVRRAYYAAAVSARFAYSAPRALRVTRARP
jgi:hypothetical protein